MESSGQGKERATGTDMEAILFGGTTGQRCNMGISQEDSTEQDQMEVNSFVRSEDIRERESFRSV